MDENENSELLQDVWELIQPALNSHIEEFIITSDKYSFYFLFAYSKTGPELIRIISAIESSLCRIVFDYIIMRLEEEQKFNIISLN